MSLKSWETPSDGDELAKKSLPIMKVDPKVPRHHPKHYGSDQLIFLVDGFLYRVPAHVLRDGSTYFEEMLGSSHLGASEEGKSDDHPISLGGISSFEMDSFLEVLDARLVVGEIELSFKQWSAALHLATMWTFDAARVYIIRHINAQFASQDPLDYIDVAMKCRVGNWLHPAYQRLCERKDQLTAEEGARLGFERFAAICRIREGKGKPGCGRCAPCKAQNPNGCTRPQKTWLQLVEDEKDLRVPF